MGSKGEDLALEFLLKRGMTLVARNWRLRKRELDLVLDDGEYIRVVEVRTRSYPSIIEPQITIDREKQRNIMLASGDFIFRHNMFNRDVVFDIVTVLMYGKDFEINYIPNAFTPEW